MNRSIAAPLAVAAGLLLSGCASASTTDSTASEPSAMAMSASAMAMDASADPGNAMQQPDEAMAAQGAWIDQATYEADPAKYHAAGDVVLFFSAAWCPTCQASVESLDRDGVPAGLTVVKVDFDSQTELKRTHGVTVQHTYVQVDESGTSLAKWTGSVSGEDIAAKAV